MELNKARLDILIAMVREYWTNINVDTAEKRLDRIRDFNEREMPEKPDLIAFLQSIMSAFGVKPTATNEEIYKVLEVLGYEVK